MNVLLITFSFPPAGGVGVLRALSLAKYLPENGIRLDVLTARNAPSVGRDASLLQQIPPEVTVHRTWTPDLPFAWRKGLKRLLSRRRKSGAPAPTAAAGPAGPGLLQTAIGNVLLPDPQVGWLPFAFHTAQRVIRSRQIDAVIITVPPFSSVRLATWLRRRHPRLTIVVDFRDEWLTTTIGLVSYNKNARARRIAQATEAAAVRDATCVVAVTEAAARELRSRYPEQPHSKFQCVPNGFDGTPPMHELTPDIPDLPVVLTYMGTVYGSTDPRSLAEAVRGLPVRLRNKLRIRFIGHVETAEHRDLLLALGDTVELVGFLPQNEALRALHRSHYLLLITHDPINVSAKLYDYLGAGRPILAALHPAGEVRRVLDLTRAGRWADVHDANDISAMLADTIQCAESLARKPFTPDLEAIRGFHRRPLTRLYADLLRTLPGSSA